MKKFTHLFPIFLFSILLSPSAEACTTFSLPNHDQLVVGKSYDWHAGHGVMFLNHKGVKKTATDIGDNFRSAASWTSKYGSMSFTQFGIDLPLGGVNEQGVVVEIMWLQQSKYPTQKRLPELNELQWLSLIHI